MIQGAMGWQNCHLHQFRVGDAVYGMQDEEWDDDEIDETEVTASQAFDVERHGTYEYDFGDSWSHEVSAETRWEIGQPLKYAVCLAGENRCPPEDVGGADGYAEFLAAIADPTHPERGSLLEWAGGSFEAAEFDVAAANASLQRVR
jgi:hypothetical protein